MAFKTPRQRNTRTRSGLMTRRLQIERNPDPEGTQDVYGAPSGATVVLGVRWGQVEPRGSVEGFSSDQEQAKGTHLIRVLRDPVIDLVERDRLRDVTNGPTGGPVYNVASLLDPDEWSFELELLATEEVKGRANAG